MSGFKLNQGSRNIYSSNEESFIYVIGIYVGISVALDAHVKRSFEVYHIQLFSFHNQC